MNGLLFQLLISVLLQNSSAEVMPTQNRGLPPALPSAYPVMPPISSTDPASARCTTGYGTDPLDGKFCMILQIAPEAIGAFAKGSMGQELTANVPDEIRNLRIDKVIVRVGSSPVERNLPNPQVSDQPSGNRPHLNDLVNRTTVPIDRSSNVQNASGNGGFGAGNNGGGANLGSYGVPNNNNGNNNSNNNTEVFPGANPSNYPDRSRLGNNGTTVGLNSPPGLAVSDGFNPTVGSQATNPRGIDVVPNNYSPNSTLSSGDSYPTKTPFYNPVKPNQNNPNSGYATNSYPSNQGYPATQGNQTSLNNYNNRPFTNLANNSNVAPGSSGYYDGSHANSGNYAGTSPSQAQSQLYGALPQQPPTPYLSSNQYPTGTNNPSLASMQISVPRQNYPPTTETTVEEPLRKDNLLPFLLLFSIVCNVYLGFWMSHQRTRYRQLMSNIRGIPVSDLA